MVEENDMGWLARVKTPSGHENYAHKHRVYTVRVINLIFSGQVLTLTTVERNLIFGSRATVS